MSSTEASFIERIVNRVVDKIESDIWPDNITAPTPENDPEWR